MSKFAEFLTLDVGTQFIDCTRVERLRAMTDNEFRECRGRNVQAIKDRLDDHDGEWTALYLLGKNLPWFVPGEVRLVTERVERVSQRPTKSWEELHDKIIAILDTTQPFGGATLGPIRPIRPGGD